MPDFISVTDFAKKKTASENILWTNSFHLNKMKCIYKQEFQKKEKHEKRCMIFTMWMLHEEFLSC